MVAPNLRAHFNDGAEGSELSTSLSGVSEIPGTAGDLTVTSAAAIRGLRGLRVVGNAVSSWFRQNVTGAQGTVIAQAYIKVDTAALPTSNVAFLSVRNSTGGAATANLLVSNGSIIVQDAGGSTRYNSGALTTGWYVLSVAVTKGTTTTNGRLAIWLRNASDDSLVGSAVDESNRNTGTADLVEVRFGKTGSSGNTDIYIDECATGWGTFGEVDRVSSNSAPTVSVGVDLTNQEPFHEIPLEAVATDPDDDPLTYLWEYVSGTAPATAVFSDSAAASTLLTLSPHTVEDSTHTIRCTVSDGVLEASDTLTIELLKVTEYMPWGGADVPIKITQV